MTTTEDRPTSDAPILVLGATGKTGRRVVAQLAAGGHPVRAMSRGAATRFDWDEESTWAAALDGTRAVYLVPPEPGPSIDRFMDLVSDAGAARVVLLSARYPAQSGDDHLVAIEAAVTEGAVPWVILRPSWFAQNFDEGFFAPALASGTLRLPTGDGREPFIDVDDIAAVAVAALTDPRHDGRTYELSGPEALSFGEAVAHLATAAGRPLAFADVEPEAFVAEAVEAGTPPALVAILTTLFAAIRAGENEAVSDGVAQVLGREPASFAAYAARAAGVFA